MGKKQLQVGSVENISSRGEVFRDTSESDRP
jgi:hypothetical protein